MSKDFFGATQGTCGRKKPQAMKNGPALWWSSSLIVAVAVMQAVCAASVPSAASTQTGEEARPARVTERELAIGPVEADALGREPVDVRRLGRGVAVAAELVVEIVGDDEQDVEFGGVDATSPKRKPGMGGEQRG